MSYPEMHMHDPFNAFKEFNKNGFYVVCTLSIIGVFLAIS